MIGRWRWNGTTQRSGRRTNGLRRWPRNQQGGVGARPPRRAGEAHGLLPRGPRHEDALEASTCGSPFEGVDEDIRRLTDAPNSPARHLSPGPPREELRNAHGGRGGVVCWEG